MSEKQIEKINLIIRIDAHGSMTLAQVDDRITELEAQVPKVVVPHMESKGDRMYCDCGELLACDFSYCPHCGAKLNWSKS